MADLFYIFIFFTRIYISTYKKDAKFSVHTKRLYVFLIDETIRVLFTFVFFKISNSLKLLKKELATFKPKKSLLSHTNRKNFDEFPFRSFWKLETKCNRFRFQSSHEKKKYPKVNTKKKKYSTVNRGGKKWSQKWCYRVNALLHCVYTTRSEHWKLTSVSKSGYNELYIQIYPPRISLYRRVAGVLKPCVYG